MNITWNREVLLTLKCESWILQVFILLEWNYEETVIQESNQYWCIFLILFLMFTGVYCTSRCSSAGARVYEWEWMGARVECCWIDSRGKWCGLTIWFLLFDREAKLLSDLTECMSWGLTLWLLVKCLFSCRNWSTWRFSDLMAKAVKSDAWSKEKRCTPSLRLVSEGSCKHWKA